MISSIILLLYLQLSAALQTGQTLELYEANGLTDLSAFLGYGVGTNPAVFISPYGLKSPMSDFLNWTSDRLSEIFVYFNFISISVLLFRRFYLFLVPKPWVVTFRQWYKTFGVHKNEDIWKSFNNTMRCMSIILTLVWSASCSRVSQSFPDGWLLGALIRISWIEVLLNSNVSW